VRTFQFKSYCAHLQTRRYFGTAEGLPNGTTRVYAHCTAILVSRIAYAELAELASRRSPVDWIFDGIGTLIVGLLVGGAGGSVVTWKVMVNRQTQKQRSGDHSTQIQAGRDAYGKE
jgi:hypothetical protein